jgi:hypothetical protein
VILTVYCRATNHRPCNDRNGRSQVQLYQVDQPTNEQIAAAKAQLEERRRRQEVAFHTRRARLVPIVRALLDEVFVGLGFDDPTGNVKNAIAGYPHGAVLAGIATFEGKRDAGTLPPTSALVASSASSATSPSATRARRRPPPLGAARAGSRQSAPPPRR